MARPRPQSCLFLTHPHAGTTRTGSQEPQGDHPHASECTDPLQTELERTTPQPSLTGLSVTLSSTLSCACAFETCLSIPPTGVRGHPRYQPSPIKARAGEITKDMFGT